jgi:hypothetical protein
MRTGKQIVCAGDQDSGVIVGEKLAFPLVDVGAEVGDLVIELHGGSSRR